LSTPPPAAGPVGHARRTQERLKGFQQEIATDEKEKLLCEEGGTSQEAEVEREANVTRNERDENVEGHSLKGLDVRGN